MLVKKIFLRVLLNVLRQHPFGKEGMEMEEKSVEIPKIKGPLREQDSIRALLELLEQQGMEQEKGDVIRMADHIDSMEMQLGTVLKELGEMKKQLGVMQESKVKLFAVNTIQKVEHQVQTLRFQVGE